MKENVFYQAVSKELLMVERLMCNAREMQFHCHRQALEFENDGDILAASSWRKMAITYYEELKTLKVLEKQGKQVLEFLMTSDKGTLST